MSRELMRQALELIEPIAHNSTDDPRGKAYEAITALRQALETEQKPVQTQQENKMPITDDRGQALRPQCQVIEQRGNWFLLYDQMQVGEAVRHEFRIQKVRHDIALYPGITLAAAQKCFREKVEADHE